MPRKPRLFVSGTTYHVYCRVARGEFVFDDQNEAAEFIEIVRKVRDLDGWHILALCLIFEFFSGHSIADLSSPLRSPGLIRGRIELTALGASRYGLRSVEIPSHIDKPPTSLTRRLNLGLIQEREDPKFRARLNTLDQQISEAARNNASMRRVAP